MKPWRTIRSQEGANAARRFLLSSLGILAAYSLWSLLSDGDLVQSGLGIGLAEGIVAFGALRYGGERLEIRPDGIVIAKLWRTQRLAWTDIAEVFLVVRESRGLTEASSILAMDGESREEVHRAMHALANPWIDVPIVGVYRWPDLAPVIAPVSGREAGQSLIAGIAQSRRSASKD